MKNEKKGLTRNFVNAAKHVCGSRYNQKHHKTLESLAKDASISVTKFDKGNGVCILRKEDYLKKLDGIIQHSTKFTEVVQGKRKNARHPLYRRQEKVTEMINQHLRTCLTDYELQRIRPSGCGIGRLYGSCKVHKKDFPVRPIVSMINTPEYELAKYLDGVIKTHIPNKYSISSNTQFLERLQEFDLQEDDYFVSFDVVSLFTNVPLNETITMVANKIFENNIGDKPNMTKDGLIKLLQIATGGIFSHRSKMYQQCDGVAMGNPLAPTLANFFMGCQEKLLFEDTLSDKDQPALYVRYVDDVFCVFRKNTKFENFMEKLNALHVNLKFTHEFGGKVMPFLDIKVSVNTNKLQTTVFRKKTNTDVVINYDAVAPMNWKSGVIKCLLHRAKMVCSDEQQLRKEIKTLKDIFHRNGYPEDFFEKIKYECILYA